MEAREPGERKTLTVEREGGKEEGGSGKGVCGGEVGRAMGRGIKSEGDRERVREEGKEFGPHRL